MTDLHTDHMRVQPAPAGCIVEPEYLSYLRSNGYNIDEIKDIQVVESESRDVAHLVYTIVTTEYPKDHPEMDVVTHSTVLRVCSCEDWKYKQSVDVGEKHLAEGNTGTCKHVSAAHRAEKAKQDDQQETL